MYCAYCLSEFTPKRWDQVTCGRVICAKRTAVWNKWQRNFNAPKLPPECKSLQHQFFMDCLPTVLSATVTR